MRIQNAIFSFALAIPSVTVFADNINNRPNIIIFLIDDLGWNDLSCYGSCYYKTPTIDSLAMEGVRFSNAYSSCTVSSPTRASLMTGKYPARLHLTDWIAGWNYPWAKLSIPIWRKYLSLEESTIAEYLKAVGYKTWHIGKWHLGDNKKFWPKNQGFDVNVAGNYKGAPVKNNNGCNGYFSPYCLPELENGPEGEYLTDRLTDEAVNLIENNDGTPFFLNMCHYAVHTPLGAKENIIKKYEKSIDRNCFHNNAVYAAMIESVDFSLKRILNVLKKKKLDNTLIIITSDNGAVHKVSKSYPLRQGKGSEYEGGIRVPLIIYWPFETDDYKCKVIETPVISMDIFSTIMNVINVKPKDDIDGISLFPISKIKNRCLFWHYPHYHKGGATPYSAVRDGDWKLIYKYEDKSIELYNLKNDISESLNLSLERPDVVYKLKNKLFKWLNDVDAQFPTINTQWNSSLERKTGKYLGLE